MLKPSIWMPCKNPHISKVTYLFTLIYDLVHKPG